MKKTTVYWPFASCTLLALVATSVWAADPVDARFTGTGKADPIRITNVSCKPSDAKGAGTITFDLAWDQSWRETWDVGEEQHGGKGKLSLENWDAAWVFIKFRKPGADGWSHATLSTNTADFSVPAGARLDVGPADDGRRGLGVFVYRGAPGFGPNVWKGVTLRWLHASDGVASVDKIVVPGSRAPAARKANGGKAGISLDEAFDPVANEVDKMITASTTAKDAADKADKTEIQVFAVAMVYVPEGAFWAGDGTTNGVVDSRRGLSERGIPRFRTGDGTTNGVAGPFTAGVTTAPFRIESEAALTLGGADSKNLGNSDGLFTSDDFNSVLTQPLPAPFPKGFSAFYCMKREITQGDWEAYLNSNSNSVSAEGQAALQKDLGSAVEIRVEGAGSAAKYVAAAPGSVCSGITWSAGMAYAGWAGLRPMTELEFEKACRGPLKPSPDEYAWGGSAPGADGGRAAARASYWGVLDLSGSLWDMTVSLGHPSGRHYAGRHGVGTPTGPDDWRALGLAEAGRGGEGGTPETRWHVSHRENLLLSTWGRRRSCGFRFVRSAAAGQAPVALPDESTNAAAWFNEALRITNLSLTPLDAKTATLKFDIAWDDSWRNATNHDAAWVFFKARTKGSATELGAGAAEWQHVRLVADKTLNPTGYGQGEGTKLECVVPAGPDGFMGVFIQRAAAGTGPLAAKGVTVVCDAQSLNTEHRTLNTSLHAFGLEMVYVAEGPFSLGSGGAEQNRFYQYTDGSQNTRPYRVLDAGTIPTGPQAGRLWATGVLPDGSDAGEIPAAFPNGYRAFYGMKYSIKQGQFAGFLAMQSDVRSADHAYRAGNGPAVVMDGSADALGLTWWQGAAFGAWAGLRPMTELEYEKACRGPLEPRPNETAAAYWGFRELNLGMVYGRVVSVATPAARAFAGTHGPGTTALPADWPPPKADGTMSRGSGCSLGPVSSRRPYATGEDTARQSGRLPNPVFNGWRGVRTAPAAPAVAGALPRAGFRLELDPLPDLRALDVSVFYLSGRFHNDTDQSMKVEVTTPMPAACFPQGAASRAFTAAPKAATPFKILTILTRQTGRAVRRGQILPIRIQIPGGDVLAEQTVLLPLLDPLAETPPVIGSIDGGTVALLVTNVTDRPQSLTFEMTPAPGVKVAEAKRNVELAAGGNAEAAFAIPGQVFTASGLYRLPYLVTMAKGEPQSCDVVAELRVQSRWWVGRRQILTGAAVAMSESDGTLEKGTDGLDGVLESTGMTESAAQKDAKKLESDWVPPLDIFKLDKRRGDWKTVTHGVSLWLGQLAPLPAKNSIVQAATRMTAPADREAVLHMGREAINNTWLDNTLLLQGINPVEGAPPFRGRVWFNGEVVYDSRPGAKELRKPVHIRKGANTLLVQCHADANGPHGLGNLYVLFHDAKDGRRIDDLVFDMEVKP